MTNQKDILYPLARDGNGRAVHIQEAPKGHWYQCFGCSAPMVTRQGTKRQWHFAHKPPFERCADPDKALHDTAKTVIMQGFSDAVKQQGEYLLGCPCKECGKRVSRNSAIPGASIEAEKTLVAGTRSDLVVNQPGRPSVIIEIVVTHDLEPETRESYEAAEVPVLKIRPAWDTVVDLGSGIITGDTLNVPPVLCAACRDAAERQRKQREGAKKHADSRLQRLNERKRSDPVKLPFSPWTHDKFGRPMFPHIRRRVYNNAIILTEMGFTQTKDKPWLFLYRPPGGGVVFANFGSTEEVPIWEDTAALMRWKLDSHSEEEKAALVEGVLTRCRRAGADVRVSFYNRSFDQQEDPMEINPTETVDRSVLSKLLAESDRTFPEVQREVEQFREAAREAERVQVEREQAERAEEARQRQEERVNRNRATQEQWDKLNEWFRERSSSN